MKASRSGELRFDEILTSPESATATAKIENARKITRRNDKEKSP